MNRMSWGMGEQRAGRPGDAFFRGRAGVVLEVAPNRFCSYVMIGTHGEITIEQDFDDRIAPLDVLSLYRPTVREVHMVLRGTLSSQEEQAEQPAWARSEHVLTGRRELEGR
jgi:hypothetical protein